MRTCSSTAPSIRRPVGVAYADYASSGYACLPGLLIASGYSRTAFHGMSPDFWNRPDMYVRAADILITRNALNQLCGAPGGADGTLGLQACGRTSR